MVAASFGWEGLLRSVRSDTLLAMNALNRPRSDLYKTCKAIDEPGVAHALTFSCFRGQAFLSRDQSRIWTIEAIRRAILEHPFSLWAYVLMHEHVHLLV